MHLGPDPIRTEHKNVVLSDALRHCTFVVSDSCHPPDLTVIVNEDNFTAPRTVDEMLMWNRQRHLWLCCVDLGLSL